SEEGRAVRVGEKEVSEQAAIVVRYADLFSREQLRALRDEEEAADGDLREWAHCSRAGREGRRARERDPRRTPDLQGRGAASSFGARASCGDLGLQGARRAR